MPRDSGVGVCQDCGGGNGGSGVVILRLPTASYSGTTSNLGHSYTDGTETILIFKQSGTLTG